MSKRALIFGIGGQDGSYLAELLLDRGYDVYGTYRRSSVDNLWRIAAIKDKVTLYECDLLDLLSVRSAIQRSKPDEVYNEADQDHVGYSRFVPHYSHAVTAGGCQAVLDGVRSAQPEAVTFQPLSATMFGDAPPTQSEATPFSPQSPYAISKVAAYYTCLYYRKTYGMRINTAIMFNHDSPRRGTGYLLGEIATQALQVVHPSLVPGLGRREKIQLRNLRLPVDIGYAREYMEAVHALMQLKEPGDYVLGTGRGYSIGELAQRALIKLGADYRHDLIEEVVSATNEPRLVANCLKLQNAIGWHPKHDATTVLNMLQEGVPE